MVINPPVKLTISFGPSTTYLHSCLILLVFKGKAKDLKRIKKASDLKDPEEGK